MYRAYSVCVCVLCVECVCEYIDSIVSVCVLCVCLYTKGHRVCECVLCVEGVQSCVYSVSVQSV